MIDRRTVLAASLAAAAPSAWPQSASKAKPKPEGVVVNDVHAQLSSALVWKIVEPDSVEGVRAAFALAKKEKRAVSIAGGRSAMGGQEFGAENVLIDVRKLSKVIDFDAERGLIEVESGVQWPRLYDFLAAGQTGRERQWTFAQKPADIDRVTIGGSLSANIHGRGLAMAPFVSDVEAFKLLDHRGELVSCSRTENTELFKLACGGYGLFGVIYSVTLLLLPRRKLERVVDVRDVDCMRVSSHYQATHGQVYWSDQQQMALYPENYHREVDRRLQTPRGTEVTTEVCCARDQIEPFMTEVRQYALRKQMEIITATVRVVEPDNDTYLAWARKPSACVTFNLHIEHSTRG